MDNRIIFKAIDNSIKKWQKIVSFGALEKTSKDSGSYSYTKCPLCTLFGEGCYVTINKKYICCPIFYFTRSDFCTNTSFYGTSVWAKSRGYYATGQNWIADNHMLSELYEVRRKFIESTYNGEYR